MPAPDGDSAKTSTPARTGLVTGHAVSGDVARCSPTRTSRTTGSTAGASPGGQAFSARRAVVSAGLVGLSGIAIAGGNLAQRVRFTCPFRALTGWRCPLCGSTTAAGHLLGGRVGAALHDNPVVVVGALGLAIACLVWSVEIVGGPVVRPPAACRPVTQRRAYLVLLAVGLAWTLVRNLLLHS